MFEPRSAHTNELVYFKGKDVLSGERMWIGVVTQNGKGGPWKFATTGDDVIQPLWKSGQPNDASNQEIWAYLGCGVKEWCDAGPTNMYRFICEYNIFDVSAIKVRTYFRIFLHKFEKMSNWSLQLMSIIKSGYFIIKKKKFQAILTKIQFSVIFGNFFSVFAYFFALKSVGRFWILYMSNNRSKPS